jgi:hypothetical protein
MSARRDLVLAVIATASVAANAARAEIINEFNFPEVREVSHQDSARMLDACGMMFRALAAAERGDRGGANGLKKEAASMLQSARDEFQRMAREMKARPIVPALAPRLPNGAPIEAIFAQRGVAIPKDTAQLADLALTQIEQFAAAVNAIDFETPAAARAGTLRVNDGLYRLVTFGVAISNLADTAR